MSENPYKVAPFEIHLYEGHNTHPAVVADPSKAKKPGWQSGYPQRYLLGNPALGVYLVHAIRMMPDGKTPMYDHYMRFERSGGVFLPFDNKGRVGLLPVPRPTTRDPEAWNKAFDEKPPRFDYSLLGRISWEAPRGFGKKGETGSQTTVREAVEEMQGTVIREFDGGWLVDNTTFCPHMTKVSFGLVDTARAPLPKDKLEADIVKAKYYNLDEIDELEECGDLYDAFTLSALHRFVRALKNGRLG